MDSYHKNESDYADIMDRKHHQSATRPHMSMAERAAQFSPFAALTGYEALIQEAGRETEKRIEPDENLKAELDEKFKYISSRIASAPEVSLTYFQKDDRKDGGAYRTIRGRVKKIDFLKKTVVMTDGTKISAEEIIGLEL